MPSLAGQSYCLQALTDAKRPISTGQVAKYMSMSWKTARDNLEALFKLGMVEKGKVGKNKRIYWRTDTKLLDSIDYEGKDHKRRYKELKIKDHDRRSVGYVGRKINAKDRESVMRSWEKRK